MASSTPTTNEFLIREHQRARGAISWNKPKFVKLCAKFNETYYEVGARIGLARSQVDQRMANDSFNSSEGILLCDLEAAIDMFKSGQPSTHDRFFPLSHG